PYLRRLRTPWQLEGHPVPMYLALAWWSSCFIFALLLPFAWLAIRLGVPDPVAHGAAGAIALWSGIDAIRRRPRVRRRAVRNAGLVVLRNRGVVVEHNGARLFVAGVDDTWTDRHDVARALAERPPGVPAVLLAHDPNLFAEASAHGVDLTLSGHTHGGQLAVPG